MKKNYLSLHTFLFLAVFAVLFFLAIPYGFAEEVKSVVNNGAMSSNKAILAITAVSAVAISCLASAYALAKIGSAALGAMSEKPEIGGRAIIFLGMAEGIAIYGLIIAIMILNKI